MQKDEKIAQSIYWLFGLQDLNARITLVVVDGRLAS
jgi:hypothetical protein